MAGKTVSIYFKTDENSGQVLEQYFESRAMENFPNENGPWLEKGWEPLRYTLRRNTASMLKEQTQPKDFEQRMQDITTYISLAPQRYLVVTY